MMFPETTTAQAPPQPEARNALVDAAASLFARSGVRGATARAIGTAAAAPVSAINYYFGSKEALLVEAARQTQRADAAWLKEEARQVQRLETEPALLSDWFAALCLHRAVAGQDSTLIAADTALQAARSGAFADIARDWDTATTGFFAEVMPAFGMSPEKASMFADFFTAVPLMVPSASGTATSAWVISTARYLADTAQGRWQDAAPWRERIERMASAADRQRADRGAIPDTPTAQRILDGATRVLIRDGAAALTHRAISEEAGVALSATTRLFDGRDAILRATFERIYLGFVREIEEQRPALPPASQSVDDFVETMSEPLDRADGQIRPELTAMEETFLAARRDPELSGLMLHLAATRGTTSAGLMASLKSSRAPTRTDAFLMSICAFGMMRSLRCAPPERRRTISRERLRARLAVLFGEEPGAV
ncbi:TetR family transcriptional regulator [Maricaulis sp.]|uniref:TetR family transcriptional regulator n=1 Tax=Maricaulis sp. TaxID=1486257 RepID=UPI001B0B8B61|nr:TetR family transcriptional regulator [Maricaulis sp.]MBO6764869.1 TetR family transcriptional regulator [Maricaulis sp.]